MRIPATITTIATLLATTLAAGGDRMEAATYCFARGQGRESCWANASVFYINLTNTTWFIDAGDGCRRALVVPGMNICVDWLRGRAHYWYMGYLTPGRKCLKKGPGEPYVGCNAARCEKSIWTEVECTWDTSAEPRALLTEEVDG